MFRFLLIIGKTIPSLVVAVALFLFGESLLVGSIVLLGPYYSFFIYFALFSFFSFAVLRIYHLYERQNNRVLKVINRWLSKKENDLNNKKKKYLRYGAVIGILILSLTAGPLPTTVFIAMIGYSTRKEAFFVLVSNAIFYSFWIAFYNGGIIFVKNKVI